MSFDDPIMYRVYRTSDSDGKQGVPCDGAVVAGSYDPLDGDKTEHVYTLTVKCVSELLTLAESLGKAIIMHAPEKDFRPMWALERACPDVFRLPSLEIYDEYRE